MATVVKGKNVLSDLLDHPVDIDSKQFDDLLVKGINFRYECEHGNVTISSDRQGYYTAAKKVDGKLRRKRIGKSDKINTTNLNLVSELLCKDYAWKEYQRALEDKRTLTRSGLKQQNEYLIERLTFKQREIDRLKGVIVEQQQTIAMLKLSEEEFS